MKSIRIQATLYAIGLFLVPALSAAALETSPTAASRAEKTSYFLETLDYSCTRRKAYLLNDGAQKAFQEHNPEEYALWKELTAAKASKKLSPIDGKKCQEIDAAIGQTTIKKAFNTLLDTTHAFKAFDGASRKKHFPSVPKLADDEVAQNQRGMKFLERHTFASLITGKRDFIETGFVTGVYFMATLEELQDFMKNETFKQHNDALPLSIALLNECIFSADYDEGQPYQSDDFTALLPFINEHFMVTTALYGSEDSLETNQLYWFPKDKPELIKKNLIMELCQHNYLNPHVINYITGLLFDYAQEDINYFTLLLLAENNDIITESDIAKGYDNWDADLRKKFEEWQTSPETLDMLKTIEYNAKTILEEYMTMTSQELAEQLAENHDVRLYDVGAQQFITYDDDVQ